jgi:NADH-quinone oxidoreductase subunit L
MVLGLGSAVAMFGSHAAAEAVHGAEAASVNLLLSGGCIAAFFHLMTHAFFKGLLFLGSGSVIHATHTQNMHEMGGLYKKMKTTGLTFILGSIALAGIFPFAGFWSKDMILANVLEATHYSWVAWIPFVMAMCAAFLTPYYMTRCVWLTFFGKPRKENHAHEGSWRTTAPLGILAVLAVFVGLAGSPFLHDWFQVNVAGGVFHEEINWLVLWGSTGLAFFGIFIGSAIYIWNWVKRETLIKAFRPIYIFLKNKWFIDELWTFVAIKPMFFFAKVFLWIDIHVIDGIVNGAAWLAGKWGELCYWFDQHIVDGMVNGFGWIGVQLGELARLFDKYIIDGFIDGIAASFGWLSGKTRKAQTGYVQNYAAVMFASVAVILMFVIVFVLFIRR